MKTAQEVRAGNVIMVDGNPMVVLKTEFNKSGRNAAVVKMKLKNLLQGSGTETVFKLTTSWKIFSSSAWSAPTLTLLILCMSLWTQTSTSMTLKPKTWVMPSTT